jgi:16S rRNA (adenine1518-N6/adenine1519-N6)-dimethyltransferase
MPLYKPTELLEFLESVGVKPKKSMSQNFLIDGNITRKIVKTADVQKGDVVLEIGPGPGSLTEELLLQGAKVLAVEKDFKLAEALRRLDPSGKRLFIFTDDIMRWPLKEELPKHLSEGQKVKVIANLPYHITTPILTSLVPLNDLISDIVVMVQDEVGRRFTAEVGSHEYGSITLFLNFWSKVHYAFKVGRSCFYPVPKVDSAIVSFKPEKPPYDVDPERFFEVTRRAFEQRRKMMRSSLRDLCPNIVEALAAAGLSDTVRPEELSLEDFVKLFAYVEIEPDKN